MEINKALTLFDYIGGNNRSDSVLEDLANKQGQSIAEGIRSIDTGLSLGQFEETLDKIENGEIEVNSATLQNYFQFNKNKLANEFNQLTDVYQLNTDSQITITDDKLLVVGDSQNAQQLQQYLDADKSLGKLIQQSSRLSKLIEWEQAKQQAASYTQQDLSESKIVDFLKDARQVVNNDNKLLFTNQGLGFISEGQTELATNNVSNKVDSG